MKAKAFLLIVCWALSACTNPIIEELYRTPTTKTPETKTISYTVAFDSNGGTPVNSLTVTKGKKATRPENPTKKGFGFVNWYDCEECAGDYYNFETPVTDDIDLYAKWSEIFYTVTFNSNGGSEVETQTIGENGTASKPVPTKEGYTFDDWYSDPNLSVLYDFDTPVSGGFTLYAKWTLKTYTVTFMDGMTVLAGLTRNAIPHGTTVNRPATDPTKDGYTFDDWYRNPELTNVYNFGTPVTGDITLYAKWEIVNITSTKDYEMVWINPGTFTMGSPEGEPSRFPVETQHQVTLTGFYMGNFEVTQEQYEAVMGNNPSYYHGGSGRAPAVRERQERRPVERVSWYDAIVFCNKLSMLENFSPVYRINGSTDPAAWGTGVPKNNNAAWNAVQIIAGSTGYRLPTEAQWEYACRAETTTAYNTGATASDDTGWYDGNSGNITHEVGLKQPNAWGLYDMHGNVWEWCWNWYEAYEDGEQTDPRGPASGDMRVIRGGSKTNAAPIMRSAMRTNCPPQDSYANQGFRLVRQLTPPTYTVTFNSGGGSLVSSRSITEGGTATRPQNPSYEDYTLFNWYTDSALGTPFNFNTPIMEDTTVYAGWTDSDFPEAVIHKIFNVSKTAEWDTIINSISSGGENKNYVVNVTASFNIAAGTTNTFSASGLRVSLRGARTLTLTDNGNILRMGNEQTVILRNLTLQGHNSNNNSLVYVDNEGTFIMQSGKVTGNRVTPQFGYGGGVYVNGTFIMNDGEVSNNTVSTTNNGYGGGVYVNGTFIMNGGKISGNNANFGGGVIIYINSTFTMNGGEVSGNTAVTGGGVYVDERGTFMMHSGKISGNKSTYQGGGVYVYFYSGKFIMHGGEISGNTIASTANNYGGGGVFVGYINPVNSGTFLMVTGTIYGNEVDATLKNTASWGASLYREGGNTSYYSMAQYGTFIGDTWVGTDLPLTQYTASKFGTSNTIKVVDGVLQP